MYGSRGTAVLHYTEDRLSTPAGHAPSTRGADLLENLLDHVGDPGGRPLLVPLADTLAFTEVAEAVRPQPRTGRGRPGGSLAGLPG